MSRKSFHIIIRREISKQVLNVSENFPYYKKLKGYGISGFRKLSLFRQDKGQNGCVKAFLQSINDGNPAIPYDQLFETTEVSIKLSELN